MRPTGRACAKCAKAMAPGCDHLENVYDWATSIKGMSEQDLIEYALNRMLALDRDNGHKKVGVLPTRRYRSNLDRHEEAVQKAKARLNRSED